MFWLAHYDLYTPKWSKHIFDEWESVMERNGVDKSRIAAQLQRASNAFPDALVCNYEGLISSLELPDQKDCHVLAAAIKANANVIVTFNLKDFPEGYLNTFGLSVKSPDDFLTDIIDLDPEKAIEAFKEMVLYKRNPPLDEYQVLAQLRKNLLKDTADYLHSML